MIILIIKKINKIVHSCNLLRISFFKRCMREHVAGVKNADATVNDHWPTVISKAGFSKTFVHILNVENLLRI